MVTVNDEARILSFQEFPLNGNTKGILYQLKNDSVYIASKREVKSLESKHIKRIILSSNWVKHKQKKIPKLIKAFEINQTSRKEYYIIYNNFMVNLTSNLEVRLSQNDFKLIVDSL